MHNHTRAMAAAAAFAVITGRKVAGLYDHAGAVHLRIAAECRGHQVQGADGDRSALFGGDLPTIFDAGDSNTVSLVIDGHKAQGYDALSQEYYAIEVTDRLVNLYDHGVAAWFAFEPQFAPDQAG
jgi:hypothetical protein